MTGKNIKVKGPGGNGKKHTSGAAEPGASDEKVDEPTDEAPQVEPVAEAVEPEQEEWRDRYVRLAADYENFKKRTERDMAQRHDAGMARVVTEVLATLDSLDRSLVGDATGQDSKAWREGLEGIQRQLTDALEKLGLTKVDSEAGRSLDPRVHEVLAAQPSAEHQPDEILQTYQVGYKLKERLLRPARVVVATLPPAPEADSEE